MDSTDLTRFERRARARYEFARLRRGLVGFAPSLVLVAVAVALARHPSMTAAFGVATFLVGALLLWYGRDVRKAVLPGVFAGSVPLVLALCATHLHQCTEDVCMTVCVPACTVGGLAAGLAVAGIGNRRRAGLAFWLPASGLALLTGAMGCSCMGYAGIAGLALGYAAGLAPGALRRLFTRGA